MGMERNGDLEKLMSFGSRAETALCMHIWCGDLCPFAVFIVIAFFCRFAVT